MCVQIHVCVNVYSPLTGYSVMLRKRYDSLLASYTQHRQRLKEACRLRVEFDSCLETVLPRLQELEERCVGVGESRDKISDRLETLRVSQMPPFTQLGYDASCIITIIWYMYVASSL